MTPEQVIALGTSFAVFLRLFEGCIAYQPTVAHLHSYCRGLLSDLPRKSVEPIAVACGAAVRTLQEFLRDHVWDHFGMRDLLQRRLVDHRALTAADDLGTIGVIDETSTAKKGAKTPGVHRQYCGARGKVENCIVTVHLGWRAACSKHSSMPLCSCPSAGATIVSVAEKRPFPTTSSIVPNGGSHWSKWPAPWPTA